MPCWFEVRLLCYIRLGLLKSKSLSWVLLLCSAEKKTIEIRAICFIPYNEHFLLCTNCPFCTRISWCVSFTSTKVLSQISNYWRLFENKNMILKSLFGPTTVSDLADEAKVVVNNAYFLNWLLDKCFRSHFSGNGHHQSIQKSSCLCLMPASGNTIWGWMAF